MKVEIVNVETIKPSSPTPLHLKTYTLSALDQVAPSDYPWFVFLYPNAAAGGGYDQLSQTLKTSLSDTLTLFPPLAGKIKRNNLSVVDCNDDGVPCYETRVHSTLDQLLLSLFDNIECLKHLVVDDEDVKGADTGGALLLVQINQFDCGGIAIGVTISHRVCDAASFITFLRSWSAKAINSSAQVIVPHLTVSTNLPPRKDFIQPSITSPPPRHDDMITARLVFDGQKIAALKAKSASPSTPQPTRVEAVTALICKCSMVASSKANNDDESYLLPYVSLHPVNIRTKLVPSLPETAFGNVVGGYAVFSEQQSDVSLDILVDKLRKARMEYLDSLALVTRQQMIDQLHVQNHERVGVTSNGDTQALLTFVFTSFCRLEFYEIDFGLGKPVWVGPSAKPRQNLVCLLDTKDGNGVEAHVTLTKQVMALFQTDPLLLHYASLNPLV